MTMTRWGVASLSVITVAAVLAFCQPWTIRPIADASATPGAGARAHAGGFDASTYVHSVWHARVLPAASRDAVDLRQALAAQDSTRRPVLVRGAGVVTSVDERSRMGRAYVDLVPTDGRPDVALQLGPVLRGTAVRDAVGFIRFTDFANQIDFARVASELNARVLASVIAPLGKASLLTGKSVTFTGATTLGGSVSASPAEADAPRIEITPLVVEIREPAR
jgi:predicted lipoprotein